ncbi:hypothetical protein PLESTM_001732700 [Pleodorina starrii]|nr:hypothetical protein PLESTM_001732700 [Pleodorina starrii]
MMRDPLEALGPLCASNVLAFLGPHDLARCGAVSRSWKARALHDGQLWAPHLARLWDGKVYIPNAIRELAQVSPHRAYSESLRDAARQLPTEAELCSFTWALNFKVSWVLEGFGSRGVPCIPAAFPRPAQQRVAQQPQRIPRTSPRTSRLVIVAPRHRGGSARTRYNLTALLSWFSTALGSASIRRYFNPNHTVTAPADDPMWGEVEPQRHYWYFRPEVDGSTVLQVNTYPPLVCTRTADWGWELSNVVVRMIIDTAAGPNPGIPPGHPAAQEALTLAQIEARFNGLLWQNEFG